MASIADQLEDLQKKALQDEKLREKLLATRTDPDPVSAFCKVCRELGYEIYEMELISAGEEFYAAIKRSTNGGGENSPKLAGEDDFYEMFFANLENENRQKGTGENEFSPVPNETYSEKETYALGEKFGKEAGPGAVFTLIGDLGAGKTVFTKGLAAGLGISEPVVSPTFTILQIYEGGRLPFYHFDVYRISDVTEMDEIGFDEFVYGDGVSLIEWADRIPEILPSHRTEVRIEKDPDKGFDYRRITICES